MPKTSVPPSNAFFGFFWWFHMWGHSVSDRLWEWLGRVSIWSDLEDIVADLPWHFGMVFWWAPVMFFTLLSWMALYAIFFAGFWFAGLLVLIVGKFMGAGWIRYGQKIMHPTLTGMPWYDTMYKKVSRSKQGGLKAWHATGLSKSIGAVYNGMMAAVGRKAGLARARIQQIQDDRK